MPKTKTSETLKASVLEKASVGLLIAREDSRVSKCVRNWRENQAVAGMPEIATGDRARHPVDALSFRASSNRRVTHCARDLSMQRA